MENESVLVRVPAPTKRKLRILAAFHDRSMGKQIEEMVERDFSKLQPPTGKPPEPK